MLKPDAISYPPRGMNREEAARYIGVGPTKFDELVADKRMPKPKRIDGRNVWDRAALDSYFSELKESENMLADLIEQSKKEDARAKRVGGS